QLPLAVARDPCDPEDLAGPQAEVDVLDRRRAAIPVGPEAVQLEHDLGADRLRAWDAPRSLDVASDHQLREGARGRPGDRKRRHRATGSGGGGAGGGREDLRAT